MTLLNNQTIYDVKGLDARERDLALCFIQGAVYCWIKNRAGETFALRDLVGGDNADWAGTPLQALWGKSIGGKTDAQAYEQAAKDAGWLLKKVLHDDQRNFSSEPRGLVNSYKWVSRGGA